MKFRNIENYTACALTYEKGRLSELARLGRYFKPFVGVRHLTKLLETEFVSQLSGKFRVR
jgi:hypothetical protein